MRTNSIYSSMPSILSITFLITLFSSFHIGNSEIAEENTIDRCPCMDGTNCNDPFEIPFLVDQSSRNILHVSSQWLSNLKIEKLRCPEQYIHLTLSKGSFAMLPNTDLIHLQSSIKFPKTFYCFKKSIEGEYLINEEEPPQVLEAEVCLQPPPITECCANGSIMALNSQKTLVCNENIEVEKILPKIYFDGKSQKWPLKENEKSKAPKCNSPVTVVPIGDAPGFGYLQLLSTGLEFRWQSQTLQKLVRLQNSDFCVGQIDQYGYLRPAIAYCSDLKGENECKSDSTPCFGKCCPEEFVYDIDTLRCEPSHFTDTWLPDATDIGNYSLIIGMPRCSLFSTMSMNKSLDDHAQLLRNGSIYVNLWNETTSAPQYCVDVYRNRTHTTPVALVCVEKEEHISTGDYVDPLGYAVTLFVTSLILLLTLVVFLIRVRMMNQTSSTDTLYQVSIACLSSFTALCGLFLGLQQLLHKQLSRPGCTTLTMLYGCFALASLVQLVFIILEQYCIYCSHVVRKMWQNVLLFVSPFLLATFCVLLASLLLEDTEETCPVSYAMIDPWKAYPISAAYSLSVLISAPFLFLIYRDLRSKPEHHPSHTEEPFVQNGRSCQHCIESEARNDDLDRWWLSIKLWAIFFFYEISYIAVWGTEQLAFWVYADIAVSLKSLVIAISLIRHITCEARKLLSN